MFINNTNIINVLILHLLSLKQSLYDFHSLSNMIVGLWVKWKSWCGRKWAWSDWFSHFKISWNASPFLLNSRNWPFCVKFALFCEIGQFHTHWILFLEVIWLQDCVLHTIWKLFGLCANFASGNHAHFLPHPFFHFMHWPTIM